MLLADCYAVLNSPPTPGPREVKPGLRRHTPPTAKRQMPQLPECCTNTTDRLRWMPSLCLLLVSLHEIVMPLSRHTSCDCRHDKPPITILEGERWYPQPWQCGTQDVLVVHHSRRLDAPTLNRCASEHGIDLVKQLASEADAAAIEVVTGHPITNTVPEHLTHQWSIESMHPQLVTTTYHFRGQTGAAESHTLHARIFPHCLRFVQ